RDGGRRHRIDNGWLRGRPARRRLPARTRSSSRASSTASLGSFALRVLRALRSAGPRRAQGGVRPAPIRRWCLFEEALFDGGRGGVWAAGRGECGGEESGAVATFDGLVDACS